MLISLCFCIAIHRLRTKQVGWHLKRLYSSFSNGVAKLRKQVMNVIQCANSKPRQNGKPSENIQILIPGHTHIKVHIALTTTIKLFPLKFNIGSKSLIKIHNSLCMLTWTNYTGFSPSQQVIDQFLGKKKEKKKSSIVGIKVKLHMFSALVTYNYQILINLTFKKNKIK